MATTYGDDGKDGGKFGRKKTLAKRNDGIVYDELVKNEQTGDTQRNIWAN